jgi:hypothetical protein
MSKDTGGPAFPRPASDAHQHGMHSPQQGMSLRDYFAAKVIQVLITSDYRSVLDNAKEAYMVADAMLKAREL